MSANHNNKKVRVAIAGVGNCASSLVQGVEFYREADPSERVPDRHGPRRLALVHGAAGT